MEGMVPYTSSPPVLSGTKSARLVKLNPLNVPGCERMKAIMGLEVSVAADPLACASTWLMVWAKALAPSNAAAKTTATARRTCFFIDKLVRGYGLFQ